MSFMDAKEARPVDDPKALVPFGWAPGGYYCAACGDCGESHSGSDKRSSRCQDCAEVLRDRPASQAPSLIERLEGAGSRDPIGTFVVDVSSNTHQWREAAAAALAPMFFPASPPYRPWKRAKPKPTPKSMKRAKARKAQRIARRSNRS